MIKLLILEVSFDLHKVEKFSLKPLECQNPVGILNSGVSGKTNVLSKELLHATPVKTPPLPPAPSIKTLSFENKAKESKFTPPLPPAATPCVKNISTRNKYIYKLVKKFPLSDLLRVECVDVE